MTKTQDRIGAAVLFAVCVFAWVRSERFPFEAQVFPRMVIVLLGVLSIAMLIRTFSRRESDPAAPPAAFFTNWRRFALTVAAVVAYVFFVSQVGYFTATIFFIPAVAAGLGYRRPVTLTLASVGFCLFVFLVFVLLFERPLPKEWLLEML